MSVHKSVHRDRDAYSQGISQTGISDIEMGSRGVDFLVVRDLCRLYQISLEGLLAELDKRLAAELTEPPPRIKRKDKKGNSGDGLTTQSLTLSSLRIRHDLMTTNRAGRTGT